jgi:hypothetical protein
LISRINCPKYEKTLIVWRWLSDIKISELFEQIDVGNCNCSFKLNKERIFPSNENICNFCTWDSITIIRCDWSTVNARGFSKCWPNRRINSPLQLNTWICGRGWRWITTNSSLPPGTTAIRYG